MRIAIASLAALATSVLACTVAGSSQTKAAAVLAGTAVGAAALNRAATGDCWSACPYGRTCDHETGTCVEATAPRLVRDAGPEDERDAGDVDGSPDAGPD